MSTKHSLFRSVCRTFTHSHPSSSIRSVSSNTQTQLQSQTPQIIQIPHQNDQIQQKKSEQGGKLQSLCHASSKNKRLCFVFPGMGSQYPGMCKDLATDFPYIKTWLQQVDDQLRHKITDIMYNSDTKTLSSIEVGSVAVYLHSLCIWNILQHEYEVDTILSQTDSTIMGHSFGEYAAITAAGLFKTWQESLYITDFFAQVMHKHTGEGQAMCAVVLDKKDRENDFVNRMDLFDKVFADNRVDIANINTPNQIVVSGYIKDIEQAVTDLKEMECYNKLRHKYLDIGGAYHSYLMKPGLDEYWGEWGKLDLNEELKCDLYLNYIGDKYETGDQRVIKEVLTKQLYRKVYWIDCISNFMNDGLDGMTDDEKMEKEYYFIEVGPKRVVNAMLKGMMKYFGWDKTRNVKFINCEDSKAIKNIENVLK